MSKLISVVVPHRLGTNEAMRRINAGISRFQPTFGRAATLKQTSWAGNTLAFAISLIGIRTAGTIEVTEDSARVEANLPLLLVPFAKRAEGLIQKHGAELLAEPARAELQLTPPERNEVRRRAKAAALAAGRDWSQLSQKERRSFRGEARKELQRLGAG
ncbi:MAG: hypothetical protein GEU91_04970 [Rhizobiales bacterium]|nr:hypothetical protein [Hyphomicrobiales bacterium]